MSNWKTKQYEIKLKISQEELDYLEDLDYLNYQALGNKRSTLVHKLNTAFHKEVVRQEKEKDIKNRVKK